MVKVEGHREFWKCNANLLECGKYNLEFSCVPSFVPAGSGIAASRLSLLTDPKVTKCGPTPVSRGNRMLAEVTRRTARNENIYVQPDVFGRSINSEGSPAGKDQTVEMIYLPGVIYSRINGKWSSVKMTAQELAELRTPKPHNDAATCKYVKDELANGEMAAVYSAHDVTPSGTVDTRNVDF